MTAVYKRELRSYFTSMVGYVFIAILIFFVGIYFMAYNLFGGSPSFGYVLLSCTIIFMVAVPILTMRSMAEDRRGKTDQLLLTSPVSLTGIVLGKYLAMITVFAVPMLVFCLYPVILSRYGEVAWAQTYAAILGFYLLGCACLAIGLFISSLTENQVMAAVLSFGVLFLFYMMSGLKTLIPSTASASFLILTCVLLAVGWILYRMTQCFLLPLLFCVVGEAVMAGVYLTHAALYEGLVQKIMDIFDISTRFSGLTDGMLDVTAIVYFLSVIAAGIFLSIQSIQKRRWS